MVHALDLSQHQSLLQKCQRLITLLYIQYQYEWRWLANHVTINHTWRRSFWVQLIIPICLVLSPVIMSVLCTEIVLCMFDHRTVALKFFRTVHYKEQRRRSVFVQCVAAGDTDRSAATDYARPVFGFCSWRKKEEPQPVGFWKCIIKINDVHCVTYVRFKTAKLDFERAETRFLYLSFDMTRFYLIITGE